jgi:hypothetical protein
MTDVPWYTSDELIAKVAAWADEPHVDIDVALSRGAIWGLTEMLATEIRLAGPDNVPPVDAIALLGRLRSFLPPEIREISERLDMPDTIQPAEAATDVGDDRYCRVCGCTEGNACHDDETGVGCHWVDQDLCSVCARGLIQGAG